MKSLPFQNAMRADQELTSLRVTEIMKECKAIFVGKSDVGKTSIINSELKGNIYGDELPTIGACSFKKTFSVEDGKKSVKNVTMQIWDTAGEERYSTLAPLYLRGASIALVIYSIIDRESFEAINGWVSRLHNYADQNISIFLVGNKCDLEEKRQISTNEGQNKADSLNARFYEVSAKTRQGIEALFNDIPRVYIDSLAKNSSGDRGGVAIDGGKVRPGNGQCCA